MTPMLHFTALDWLQFTLHYVLLSFLTVGGAMASAPEMHRFLVGQQHWLSDAQFNAALTISQAAPGPNVLSIALMGWNVGLNNGSTAWAALGLTCSLIGILLPSTLLVYFTARWSHANREQRGVRAFKQGLAPVVVALVLSTGWILAHTSAQASAEASSSAWLPWLITAVTALLVWRTKIHLLWLLGAGALLGALGFV